MPPFQVELVRVTSFQQNCALIYDAETKKGAIIDPGGDLPRITAMIERAGVTVEQIYLTHGHLDHVGAATALAKILGVDIIGPDARDEFLLSGIAETARRFGFPDADNVAPDRWLTEGDKVSIAGGEFEVLHCPGHTPGHVVFVNRQAGFGIMGDVLFRGSVGRTDFPYGDSDVLLAGIRDKLLPLPDDFSFICGHGPGSTIGNERRSNPFLR